MAVITNETQRDGVYLGECASLNIVNAEIIVASGAGVLKPGAVLGMITASGKFVAHDDALANGAEAAAAILFSGVDATSADAKAVATVRGPATIFGPMLIWKTGISAANKKIGEGELRAKGMAVIPQHA